MPAEFLLLVVDGSVDSECTNAGFAAVLFYGQALPGYLNFRDAPVSCRYINPVLVTPCMAVSAAVYLALSEAAGTIEIQPHLATTHAMVLVCDSLEANVLQWMVHYSTLELENAGMPHLVPFARIISERVFYLRNHLGCGIFYARHPGGARLELLRTHIQPVAEEAQVLGGHHNIPQELPAALVEGGVIIRQQTRRQRRRIRTNF
jgi:hypothetical protein